MNEFIFKMLHEKDGIYQCISLNNCPTTYMIIKPDFQLTTSSFITQHEVKLQGNLIQIILPWPTFDLPFLLSFLIER